MAWREPRVKWVSLNEIRENAALRKERDRRFVEALLTDKGESNVSQERRANQDNRHV